LFGLRECVKRSDLYINGTIQPRYLKINERVRQFGGDPNYARFLMYLGLGLLKRQRQKLYFKYPTEAFVCLPRQFDDHDLVKHFETLDEFLTYMFPDIGQDEDIPQTHILTTKNVVTFDLLDSKIPHFCCVENMNKINEECLKRYRPNGELIVREANNYAYNPDMNYNQDKLNGYEGGEFPPHKLELKVGCTWIQNQNKSNKVFMSF